jgi:hypothetical protein
MFKGKESPNEWIGNINAEISVEELKLKNTISEMEILFNSFNSRLNITEEKIQWTLKQSRGNRNHRKKKSWV